MSLECVYWARQEQRLSQLGVSVILQADVGPDRFEPVRKIAFLLVCCFGMLPACSSTEHNHTELKSLYDTHQWFALRDAVKDGNAPAFYQGATACAFNDLTQCEKQLGYVFASEPKSEEAVEAHRLLVSVYLRAGRYKDALAQADLLLASKPGDSDVGGDRPLLAALGEFPDQSVSSSKSSTLKVEDGLPISINGLNATYWFDTGANLSVMSQSEAKRFGLSVHEVQTQVSVITGSQVAFRIAIADEVKVGGFVVKHVAFMVFPDEQPPFNDSPQESRGLIGLPVLLALGRFAWEPNGSFELAPEPVETNTFHQNLCFEGKNPVAEVRFKNRELSFILDTGATTTELYPPFASKFSELIRTSGKKESHQMMGVGSVEHIDSVVLPSADFQIGGYPVLLRPATVLLTSTGESSKFFYGNLGVDLLKQARRVVFDFKTMALTLQ
jgi:clan AA aspartic protease (TIGR02281 family)